MLKAVIRSQTSSEIDPSLQGRVRKKDQGDFAGHSQHTRTGRRDADCQHQRDKVTAQVLMVDITIGQKGQD